MTKDLKQFLNNSNFIIFKNENDISKNIRKKKKRKSIQKTETGFLFSNRVKLAPTLSEGTILYDELLLGPREFSKIDFSERL